MRIVTESSPRITLSFAQSLDGRIATRTGVSRWISGGATLTLAHRLRRDSDAVLVGIGTVIADDPELTCRLDADGNVAPSGGTIISEETPSRIVVDTALQIPTTCRLVDTARSIPTIVLCSVVSAGSSRAAALEQLGVRVAGMETDSDGHIAPGMIAAWVHNSGFRTLMIEGGRKILTSFLRERLVDRMVVVTAPLIIGEGVSAIGDLGVSDLADAYRADSVSTRRAGQDMVWDLRFRRVAG
jgi:5-amino-6-(5-phosphoribosylamino)uracil reductase/diaminohydroxyphosphoribosylaminopyrimidine deaminase/5-amino-6-(5-phosphoribosylamino)uracil reductase